MNSTLPTTYAFSFTNTQYYSTSPISQIQFHQTQLALLRVPRGAKAEFRVPRLACVSNSAALGGGGGGGGGGEGGGGGGGGGGEVKGDWMVVGVDDVFDELDDVIVLNVEGMTCGGCSGKVKRILESRPQVSAASVNHQTKMAIVWPVPEAKVTPNWQTVLGEELAKHLTTCGFNSNLRSEAATERETS